MLAQMGEALSSGARGFTLAVDHGHLRLRLTIRSTQPDRLTTGGDDPLLPIIAQRIDTADKVDLAVAFAMDSGVQLISPWFRDLIDRGGRLRIVVGDYMDVTEPAALSRLSDVEGAQVRVGGMQFFRTEGFDTFGKALPRATDIARHLLVVYAGLTVICITVYSAIGMTTLDAVARFSHPSHGVCPSFLDVSLGRQVSPFGFIAREGLSVVIPDCMLSVGVGERASAAQVIKLALPLSDHRPHSALRLTLVFGLE